MCMYMYFEMTRIDRFAVPSMCLFKTVDWAGVMSSNQNKAKLERQSFNTHKKNSPEAK